MQACPVFTTARVFFNDFQAPLSGFSGAALCFFGFGVG
jgi:hypothetical protein